MHVALLPHNIMCPIVGDRKKKKKILAIFRQAQIFNFRLKIPVFVFVTVPRSHGTVGTDLQVSYL